MVPVGTKVLIVLDQFEQWLHANRDQHSPNWYKLSATATAVGCSASSWCGMTSGWPRRGSWSSWKSIWFKATIPRLRTCSTSTMPGRCWPLMAGPLASSPKTPAPDPGPKAVPQSSRPGLAQENKIICVRLALFAEMIKAKPWTPATLKEVGGTEGVGVTFLEETFSSISANPKHRYHQKAARAVLKALCRNLAWT